MKYVMVEHSGREVPGVLDGETALLLSATDLIGKTGKNIPVSAAVDHVWGYLLANDVSQRDLQRAHGGQWLKGKSIGNAREPQVFLRDGDVITTRADRLGSLRNRVTRA